MGIKKVLLTLSIFGIILLLGACNNNGGSEKEGSQVSESSGDATVIRYNSSRASTDPVYSWYEEFFNEIEEKSNGTVQFEMFSNEALGSSADMIEAASLGEPVISDGDFSYLGDYHADLGMLSAPYFVREPEDWITLWDSEIGQDLLSELENHGLKVMANFYVGPRNLITTEKVTSRDEVKGMSLRTAGSKMWNEVGRVLGGDPTNVPISEAYQSFSQGIADGAEMSTSYIEGLSWYEVAPYITETEHLMSTTALTMSSDVYNSLPEEAKLAIDEVAYEYMPVFIERIGEIENELRNTLEENGAVFTEVDKEPFIEAAEQLPERFPEWTSGLYEEIQAELGY